MIKFSEIFFIIFLIIFSILFSSSCKFNMNSEFDILFAGSIIYSMHDIIQQIIKRISLEVKSNVEYINNLSNPFVIDNLTLHIYKDNIS